MTKIGRNDPCPCGSGKKYKKCCLIKKQRDFSEEYIRNLVNETDKKLFDELIRFSVITFGSEVFDFAWQDFTLFEENEFIEESNPHNQLFFPWLLYSWHPDDFYPIWRNLKNKTIAELYLEKNILLLNDFERNYIRNAKTSPFSFYEVADFEYDQYLIFKDFFTDEKEKVVDHALTHNMKINNIMYCRVINIESMNFILGCSSIAIPPNEKIRLLDLKADVLENRKKITNSMLLEWSDEIRREYLDIYEFLTTPPKLVNKSGDPLSFNDIKYEISDPVEVWELLKHLDYPFTEEEFTEEAELDNNGKLYKIQFNWLSPKRRNELAPSIYAHIEIEGNQLMISVNSNKRAKYVKTKMKSLLGEHAKYKLTITKSLEAALKDHPKNQEANYDPKMKEIEESPEFQEFWNQYLENHWKNWINNIIPALGNITPKQALNNEKSKQKLLLLLEKFECDDERLDPKMKQIKYIKLVRKELGL